MEVPIAKPPDCLYRGKIFPFPDDFPLFLVPNCRNSFFRYTFPPNTTNRWWGGGGFVVWGGWWVGGGGGGFGLVLVGGGWAAPQ